MRSLPSALAGNGISTAPGEANRVVCGSRHIDRLLDAIGARDKVVRRDLTSIHALETPKLTSVGGHLAFSAEGILSLRPSLFITDGTVGPDAVLD
jgi:iron complex transport system substrate-binding protein